MAETLDCKGLMCPMPIVKLSKAMKVLNPGETLEVIGDDPAFGPDVRAWCAKMNAPLLSVTQQGVGEREQFARLAVLAAKLRVRRKDDPVGNADQQEAPVLQTGKGPDLGKNMEVLHPAQKVRVPAEGPVTVEEYRPATAHQA